MILVNRLTNRGSKVVRSVAKLLICSAGIRFCFAVRGYRIKRHVVQRSSSVWHHVRVRLKFGQGGPLEVRVIDAVTVSIAVTNMVEPPRKDGPRGRTIRIGYCGILRQFRIAASREGHRPAVTDTSTSISSNNCMAIRPPDSGVCWARRSACGFACPLCGSERWTQPSRRRLPFLLLSRRASPCGRGACRSPAQRW